MMVFGIPGNKVLQDGVLHIPYFNGFIYLQRAPVPFSYISP